MSETPHADHQRKLEYVRVVNENDELKKRIAELEADFHRIAEAVLGDIHEGEASVQDVLDYIRRLSDSENQAIDCIAELEADNEGWQRSHSEDQHRIHDLKAKVKELERRSETAEAQRDSVVLNLKEWRDDVGSEHVGSVVNTLLGMWLPVVGSATIAVTSADEDRGRMHLSTGKDGKTYATPWSFFNEKSAKPTGTADADSTGTKYKGTICPKCDKIGGEAK